MHDPLSDVVTLLQPGALLSKSVTGAGSWRVRREASDETFYCVVLEGTARFVADGQVAVELSTGDFVLVPMTSGFVMSGGHDLAPSDGPDPTTVTLLDDGTRHGDPSGTVNARLLIGHFSFASQNVDLLPALLPDVKVVQHDGRLTALVRLVSDEARASRPVKDIVIGRLLEVMLIEVLRAGSDDKAPPGLARGLADPRISVALRNMHQSPATPWTIASLATEAALSRSAFFDRFQRTVGMAPIEYLIGWRMALAKNWLIRRDITVGEIAERLGYGSVSAFSQAFSRVIGVPPARYGRERSGSTQAVLGR